MARPIHSDEPVLPVLEDEDEKKNDEDEDDDATTDIHL